MINLNLLIFFSNSEINDSLFDSSFCNCIFSLFEFRFIVSILFWILAGLLLISYLLFDRQLLLGINRDGESEFISFNFSSIFEHKWFE